MRYRLQITKAVRIALISAVSVFAAIGLAALGAYVAISLHWTDVQGVVDAQRQSFSSDIAGSRAWIDSPEWQALKIAMLKDQSDIDKAAKEAGVSPRFIIGPLMAEQLRLFSDDRELFKAVFAPLKILGVQSQYSWGVLGMKEGTAKEIEAGLADPSSPFYPGPSYAHLLDYSATTATDTARFERLTDPNSRYYSYLYAALYEKEILSQWKRAGFDISDRPEIVFTLYNIGFDHSVPNADPHSGGAEIDVGGHAYSFGELAADFYYSDELPGFAR